MTPEEGDQEGQRIAETMNEETPAIDEASDVEVIDEAVEPGQVEALEKELAETKDRLLRIAADFENYRKRAKREQEDAQIRGREEILKELLAVFDNLDRAIEAAGVHAKDEAASAIIDGVTMVQKQFADGLSRFGLTQFSALGQPFDPNFHEAVAQMNSAEHPPGVVIQEYQKGYMLGERLLRAAMVVVSSASSTGKVAQDEEATAPDAELPEEQLAQGEDGAAESEKADGEGSA
jgi:molecular chaperone GrpE